MYKVIIAEDEMFVRLGIKMSVNWESMGMEVVADAANGKQALEAYEQLHPDIVITDIKMPVLDGMELIRHIRENDKDTRIVILTCLEEFSLVKEAITQGVSDYILKLTMTPEEMEKVLLKVRGELEKRQQDTAKAPAIKTQELQERVLKNFLFYQLYDEQQFSLLPLEPKNLVMTVLELDNYDEICELLSDLHGSLAVSSILNIIREMLEKYKKGMAVHMGENRFLIVISDALQEHKYITEQQFIDWTGKVRKNLQNYFKGSCTFGLSEVGNHIKRLPQMYEQCCEALKGKFFLGGGQNLLYKDLNQESWHQMIKQAIVNLSKSAYLDEAAKKQMEAGAQALNNRSDKNVITNFFIHLISVEVNRVVIESEKRFVIIDKYADMVSKASTMQEITEIYKECMNTLYESGSDGEVVSKTVSDIIRYISKNYTNVMTLDSIADYVEMSPNYICGLFKKEMGTNLMNYIMKFRIQKASELMMTTHLKSYEIAEKVGFSDESYFSRCFKKMTGLSPNEFRKHADGKEIKW